MFVFGKKLKPHSVSGLSEFFVYGKIKLHSISYIEIYPMRQACAQLCQTVQNKRNRTHHTVHQRPLSISSRADLLICSCVSERITCGRAEEAGGRVETTAV